MKRNLKDCQPGEVVFATENLGDDRNNMEVRDVFYVRDPDGECRHANNVRCGLIGMVQGDVSDPLWIHTAPRVMRISAPTRDPGEADGRTQVQSIVLSQWAKHPMVERALTNALGTDEPLQKPRND